NDAGSYVQDLAGEEANIIFGAKYDESVPDAATITVIATGLESPQESPSLISVPGAKYGANTSSMNLSRTAGTPVRPISGSTQTVPKTNTVQRPTSPTPSVPQKDIKIPDFLKTTRR
ncbi:MAG: cell division protein FtsZ, partial [Clostridiales bacterium]|nr:cell division protein FtsZ [Clostridiales bacterium]